MFILNYCNHSWHRCATDTHTHITTKEKFIKMHHSVRHSLKLQLCAGTLNHITRRSEHTIYTLLCVLSIVSFTVRVSPLYLQHARCWFQFAGNIASVMHTIAFSPRFSALHFYCRHIHTWAYTHKLAHDHKLHWFEKTVKVGCNQEGKRRTGITTIS